MLNRKGCRVVAMGPGLLAAVIVLASAAVSGAEPLTLFVSPQGDDHWSGRIVEPNGSRTDGPLATIGRARDAIRELRTKSQAPGAITVLVRGGSYELKETSRFHREDGGTATAPVVYRAYPGERPVIRGGAALPGSSPIAARS